MTGISDKDNYRFRPLTIWTPEMDRVLCEMYNNGASTKIIGEHFGVSRNSIIGRTARLRAKGLMPELSDDMKAYKQKLGTAFRVARQMKQPPKPVKSVAPRLFMYKPQPQSAYKPQPKPAPKQEVVKVAPVEEPSGANRTVLAYIKPNGCRWIDSDFRYGDGGETPMCGDPKQEGSAFCSHHHKIAYVPQTNSERANRQRSLLRTGQWAGKR